MHIAIQTCDTTARSWSTVCANELKIKQIILPLSGTRIKKYLHIHPFSLSFVGLLELVLASHAKGSVMTSTYVTILLDTQY